MIAIIIQARINSTRLPGKIFKQVGGVSLLEHLLRRLLTTSLPIIVAVPTQDEVIFKKKLLSIDKNYLSPTSQIQLFAGNEADVLSRYVAAARLYQLSVIIRVTGDNPLTSEECLEKALEYHLRDGNDLTVLAGLPHGAGVEVLSFSALDKAFAKSTDAFEKEHVTPFIYRHPEFFKINDYPCPSDYFSKLRITIDTQSDLDQLEKWFTQVGFNQYGFIDLKKILECDQRGVFL